MKEIIHTNNAPAAVGPYVQARKIGNLIFTSGQLGLEPAGNLVEGVEAQAHQSMKNIGEVLKAAGAGYGDIVKALIFVQDLADFNTVNEVYASYFEEGNYPARSCVQAAALPKGGLVEIEVIAMLD